MVCVPCVAIPIFLTIWRFIIQPLILKLWSFWKTNAKDVDEKPPELVQECKNGVCTLSWKRNKSDEKSDIKDDQKDIKCD